MNTTPRPNHWNHSWPCPHNELAYDATGVWCETCGADVEEN